MRKDKCLSRLRLLPFLQHFSLFLLFACLLTSCESRRTIVNGLDEKEANEILVFLSTKGIDANKVQAITEGAAGGGKGTMWNISVESSQANEAMALLNQVGLPRRRGQNLLGIFSNVGLVPSGMQEKVRYQAGLAEQIASTIRKIDGVLDADVQISFPDEDPLNPTAAKQKITASVYVKHSGVLDDPNAHLITRIKRLVAGSVNGLDYDNVTVIGDRARFSEASLGGLQGSLSEEDRPYVHVWSIILAKDSLSRFRLIFFSFTISILLLILLLIWILWKIFPLLKAVGGIKKLFSFQPLQPVHLATAPAAKIEEAKEDSKTSKKEEESNEGDGVT
jgi:type III secretion protein J